MTGATFLLQSMAADPGDTDQPGAWTLQGWEYRPDEPMLDGPVMRRLAVVDIDPTNAALRPPARLQKPARKGGYLRYRIADPTDPESDGFRAVSAFSTVLRTMLMFEEPDVLGRPLTWAFAGQQLLIVPEAGEMANAFYHRASRSLSFFSWQGTDKEGKPLRAHTCLSPDIVVHEATHAIVDGIAPDLYDATSPQSLALHEAMADLATVVNAVRTQKLRKAVLARTGGDLRHSTAFNEIAPQLGQRHGSTHPLRDLGSPVSLAPGGVAPASHAPHDLSLVVSSAMFALLPTAFRRMQAQALGVPDWDFDATSERSFSASGKSLAVAADIFKRVSFRALDYLPPGEAGFADYARAVIAADRFSNPDDPWVRDFLVAEFLRRGMVTCAEDLVPALNRVRIARTLDLDQLVASDWVAWSFCEANRSALMIPRGAAFEIRPRIDARRTTYRGKTGRAQTREVLVKVVWHDKVMLPDIYQNVREVAVARGTMLAIDHATRKAHLVLSTAPGQQATAAPEARRTDDMRAAFLRQALETGQIVPGTEQAHIAGGVLRLRGLGQLLHMAGGWA